MYTFPKNPKKFQNVLIFYPQDKGKNKTTTRGFWQSESGKIFYDYIKVKTSYTDDLNYIQCVKETYNQECIFFIKNQIANIYYDKKKIIKLKNRHLKRHNKFSGLKDSIKSYLKIYGGVTVYIKDDFFVIEAWS